MNKISFLTALLIAQLALAYYLSSGSAKLEAFHSEASLIELELGDVTEVALYEVEGEPLIIRKSGSDWLLPNYHKAPVSAERIDTLLEQLLELKRPYPMAVTEAAARKLKVTEDGYERKITLRGPEGSATILFGSSPTFRQVYVRLLGDEEIFEVPFDTFEISVEPSEWFNNGVLHLQEDEVLAVEGPDFRILREGEEYRLADMPEGEVVNEASVKAFIGNLRALSFVDLALQSAEEQGEKQADGEKRAALVLKVERSSGEVRTYSFTPAGEHEFHLTVSDKPYRFEVPASTVEALTVTKENLLIGETAPPVEEGKEEKEDEEKEEALQEEVMTPLEEIAEADLL